MSQVIKSFLGIFILLLLCSVGIGIFVMFLSVLQAQNLHADIMNELENSAFERGVIKDCFEKADAMNYRLRVRLFQNDHAEVIVSDLAEIPQETNNVVAARVELYFDVGLPFVPMKETHVLEAYAF